jgi:class 3 adenylate cyclase
VTVLFADVVHSMDIAAAVGPERLREIMAELVNRAAEVVQRYGGTVDKFTTDPVGCPDRPDGECPYSSRQLLRRPGR